MHNTVLITQDTHKLYPLCEACSVFATHNKFIVEVLEKNIRSTEFIDHSLYQKPKSLVVWVGPGET